MTEIACGPLKPAMQAVLFCVLTGARNACKNDKIVVQYTWFFCGELGRWKVQRRYIRFLVIKKLAYSIKLSKIKVYAIWSNCVETPF